MNHCHSHVLFDRALADSKAVGDLAMTWPSSLCIEERLRPTGNCAMASASCRVSSRSISICLAGVGS